MRGDQANTHTPHTNTQLPNPQPTHHTPPLVYVTPKCRTDAQGSALDDTSAIKTSTSSSRQPGVMPQAGLIARKGKEWAVAWTVQARV